MIYRFYSLLQRKQSKTIKTNMIDYYLFATKEPAFKVITLLKKWDKQYHSGDGSDVPDDIYDLVKGAFQERDPNHPYFKSVGAPTRKKTALPYYMGSMRKIKTNETYLKSFLNKIPSNNFVISDKLDGVSALFYLEKGKPPQLFTRGDGYFGQNISWMLPHLKKGKYDSSSSIVIRGELIMSKKNFKAVSHQGANARNMVAGVVNSKTPDLTLLEKIVFVAYTLIKPELTIEKQLQWLNENNWHTVYYQIENRANLNFQTLSNILEQRRQKSEFEIDGIIVSHNGYFEIEKGSNPSYAFAFKNIIDDNKMEVIVNSVEWNVSKHGLLKPVVIFNPVHLGGVIIQRATGFNAQFIKQNVVGPGSRIMITRSGDVIPHIINVITKAENGQPMMPSVPFVWGKSGVDILVKDHEQNKEVQIQSMISFFSKIKVDGFSHSSVRKMFDQGFRNPQDIIFAREEDFKRIIGEANGEKIFKLMQTIKNNIDCVTIMDASNSFGHGLGSKKIKSIIQHHENIQSGYIPSKSELIKIEGISDTTADNFIKGMHKFNTFMKNNPLIKCTPVKLKVQKSKSDEKQGQNMEGEIIVFTGFRDKELEKKVENQGGKVASALSKKTTLLVYKSDLEKSTKMKQAQDMGIKTMDYNNFKILFLLT